MILGPVVLLALAAGSTDGLARAQQHFTEGDYPAAEAAALEAARPPEEGAALYLAGLARFRHGRAGPALEALDLAGRAGDPPARGPWQFNRGACLYELGRFAEAEEAFGEAAALEPGLAALALADAGFAALDGGAPDRARALAERARVAGGAAPPSAVLELLEALARAGDEPPPAAAEAHRAGLAAYDAGRFQEAREQFRRAAALAPASPSSSLLMAGAATLALGERAEARAEFARLLQGPLDEPERRLAADYFDAASYGLAQRGPGWDAMVRAGPGYDSNVTQSGPVEVQGAPGASETSSALFVVAAGLGRRWRLSDGGYAQLAYGLDQLAYLARAAEDYSLQQHLLAAAVEVPASSRVRLGLEGQGGLDFTGLGDFRGMQATAGAAGWAAWDASDLASTRLDLGWTHRWALREEFGYLGGDRLEARLGEELRLGGVTVELGYRFRDEAIGTLVQATASETFVLPQAYRAHGPTAGLRARLGARVDLGLAGGYEWRTYASDSWIERQQFGVTSVEGRMRREDRRAYLGAAAGLAVSRTLSLALRYDLVLNRSNAVGPQGCQSTGMGGEGGLACSPWDDKNFDKQVVTLEAVLGW